MLYQLKVTILMTLCLLFAEFHAQGQTSAPQSLLEEGRELFALSLEQESQVQPAIDLFERLVEQSPSLGARASAYIGALYTIKAKHTTFPFDKLKWAKRGLKILDEALEQAPDDIEVLFVHGAICQNLPALFKRGDDARRDFSRIVALLPDNMHRYDEQFIGDVLDYLNTEVLLTKEEEKIINEINSNLSLATGENN